MRCFVVWCLLCLPQIAFAQETAHLWVGAAGTCTRSATPAAYNAGTACSSVSAAYTAANASANASTVLIKGGTYGAQNLIGNRSSSNLITIDEATGETATFTGLITFGDGNTPNGPDYIILQNVTGAEFGSGTCPDCRYGIFIRAGSSHITVNAVTAGMVQIHGSTYISVTNSNLGPCRARTDSTSSTSQNEDGCSFNKVDWFGARPQYITYENNILHDYDMTASCFSTANGGTNTAGQPDCHWRPFWCIGCNELVFRGNVVRDSKEGPALANTGDGGTTGGTNILIENNFFGPGINHGGGSGTWGGRNYGNNGGMEIGWCNTNQGVLAYDGLIYRFNSHAPNSGFWIHEAGAGSLCNDDELSDISAYGNIGARSPCRTPVTYAYNVYPNTGTCAASDVNIGAGGTIPFYQESTDQPDDDSYKIVGTTTVADSLVPVAQVCPATDKFGTTRPVTGTCTAGAHERTGLPAAPTNIVVQ